MKKKLTQRRLNMKRLAIVILAVLLAAASLFLYQKLGHGKQAAAQPKITVELDAAFGGDQPGYAGIITEAEFNEKTVDALEKLLKKDDRFEVLRTHEAGTAMAVSARAAKIAADKPDIVLCIRAAHDRRSDVTGMTIYADLPTNAHHEESLKLADAIRDAFTTDAWKPAVGYLYYHPTRPSSFQERFIDESDTTDYAEETLSLMQACDVPVVISAGIRVTSQADIDAWANDDGYEKAAEQYYAALKACYGAA